MDSWSRSLKEKEILFCLDLEAVAKNLHLQIDSIRVSLSC